MATKEVVKQISSQEANPQSETTVFAERVTKYEKIIAGLILFDIILAATGNLAYFTFMDTFLATKYHSTYEDWRDKEIQALKSW